MVPRQTVWLVTQIDTSPLGASHDVSGLTGVFSTEDKARAWIAAQPKVESTNYYADEWKVDHT